MLGLNTLCITINPAVPVHLIVINGCLVRPLASLDSIILVYVTMKVSIGWSSIGDFSLNRIFFGDV